jgi:hypothetical protein
MANSSVKISSKARGTTIRSRSAADWSCSKVPPQVNQ